MNETITQTKCCSKCKIEQSVLEFSKNKSTKDGMQSCCKNCFKEYSISDKYKEKSRLRYQNDIEYRERQKRRSNTKEARERHKEYQKTDHARELNRIRILNNLDKRKAYLKNHYQTQGYKDKTALIRKTDRYKAYRSEYIKTDKHREYIKNYLKTDKGKMMSKNVQHSRRSQKKKGDVTTNQLLELKQNAKICYWCNQPLKNKEINIDHYDPIKKGGEHTLSNLVITCQTCNKKKHAKDPIEFANSIGKLL